ncbi:MAG: hypothetical protein AAGI91_07605 [Bacteroidota bacterium]
MLARALPLALLVALAPPAVAQPDISAQPLYGTVTLSAGFQPDPHRSSVVAGGTSENPVNGAGCVGYLNMERPDLDLNYTAGSYPLRISVDSSTDTALLINQPDGSWVCDDDGGDGSDPLVVFSEPQSGNYNIWVTTYNANAQSDAVVSITEAGSRQATASSGSPNIGAQPLYGTMTLSSGFQPDPQVNTIQAGGSSANPISGAGCVGYINLERPDLDLNFTPGAYPLYIYVRAASDTTLLVNLPDGSWVCSDDATGSNPMVQLSQPMAGNYNIWVGTYQAGATQQATVYVSEVAPAK